MARYTSPQSGIDVQWVTSDATALADPVISVRVDDIDSAYALAQERGYEIVHPLSTEKWGVTRFFVRAPDGNISTSSSTAIDASRGKARGAVPPSRASNRLRRVVI